MLDLIDVTKSYPSRLGRRYIFRDFNLSIPDGCNAGLIGPNGAGKSTLMRLLGGLEHLDSGRIATNRHVSWPIGLAGGLQGSLTGRDNVRFVCRIHAASADEIRAHVAFVQEFAEIGAAFDLPVKTYSSGMRSRLMFGLAMAFDFDLYLIDEVTAVGDAAFRKKSQELLQERLSRSNVIYTSHNMGEIARLCNLVVLLKPGSATIYHDVQEGIAAYQQPTAVSQREAVPA
ncbi:ABC transporter ATP-binding protein [Sphaerotilus sp.]|uniref:ABC transporter ATP-binding protein n=1 Tax=Sphaerotilus sp. TaxID=2093942 RepID=UPI0034E2AF43